MNIDPRECIFIDETRVDCSDTGRYGYSKRGERTIVTSSPRKPGVTVTLAMTSDGFVHHMITKGPSNRAEFLKFLAGLQGCSGRTLVMDNVRFHHAPDVLAACKTMGVDVMYTPPYSPDFNPIENVFGILKHRWRTMDSSSRTYDAFVGPLSTGVLQRCVRRAWDHVKNHVCAEK